MVSPRASVPLLLLLGLPAAAQADGFVPLFDGKTLRGWEGDAAHWRVEDGAIVGEITPERPLERNTFLIWTLGDVDDFELRFAYRVRGGNSGVQYRSERLGERDVKGYQADIDGLGDWTGACYHEHGRGPLARRGERATVDDVRQTHVEPLGDPATIAAAIERDGWHEYAIAARGNRLLHTIHGIPIAEVVDEGPRESRRQGLLALQIHAGPPMQVRFRDLRLRRLPLEDRKKLVLVAGTGSHGYAAHEHGAGCRLLAERLNASSGVLAAVYYGGWPEDPTAFANADALLLYMDGGAGHAALPHLDAIRSLTRRGVGLACLHYALEMPAGPGQDLWLEAIGGAFETHWSTTQAWTADFASLPEHPTTRGVPPFVLHDEWYFHMRFRPQPAGVTPILTATPPDAAHDGPDGPHSGNPHVRARKGQPEVVAWCVERPGGGRGFACTGGHVHWSWAHDGYRKLLLNALTWVAGAEVPPDGVASAAPTLEQLEQGQDEAPPAGFDREAVQRQLAAWRVTR